jgi:hypothetical protein
MTKKTRRPEPVEGSHERETKDYHPSAVMVRQAHHERLRNNLSLRDHSRREGEAISNKFFGDCHVTRLKALSSQRR